MKPTDRRSSPVNSLTPPFVAPVEPPRQRGTQVAGRPRMTRSVVLVAAAVAMASAACSSSSSSPDGTGAAPASASGDTPDDAGADPPPADAAPATDACGAVPKSQCKPANPGSVVRGVVRFDPAHYAGKNVKPVLRVFLHHQFVLQASEAKQGGHPHAFDSFTNVDMEKGEARFTIDLCELGTAMWSEENCGFNLVAMLDEDGSNDPYKIGQTAFLPQKGELVGMTPLEISCHKPSSCLEIKADCDGGDTCTTYTPITKCACAADSCPSDDAICKL